MLSESRRGGAVVLLVAVALLLCGCSEIEPGSPELKTTTSSPNNSSTISFPSEIPSKSEMAIESLHPCSLLTKSELAEFGDFGDGNYRVQGSGRNCYWRGVRESASDSSEVPIVDVIIEDEKGLDDLADIGGGVRTGRTDATGRKVKQTWNEDGCVVGLAVGENSRVDAIVSMIELNKACDMADRIVEIIDPRLPVG